tara:strand:+ start:328 stop:1467 length:1140 start_codon:yes stop_codon:yes gene_type:complete
MLTGQEARHAFASLVHFIAFWFLLGFALAEDSTLSVYKQQFWWVRDKLALTPRRWHYQCVDETGKLNATLLDCAENDRRFYVKSRMEGITHVNVLVLACLYVMWSAIGHLLSVFMIKKQRLIRWVDYSVTAPTMLVVLSVSFGADSLTAIVIAPCVLAVLLVIAGILEPDWSVESVRRSKADRNAAKADEATTPPEDKAKSDAAVTAGVEALSYYRRATIAILFLAYIPAMVPVLYASYDITVDHAPGTGTAPDFVFVFSVMLVVLFSSFAGLYLWDLVWPIYPDRRERGYIFLSMVSKTTLHLFLGLAVIGQSNTVGVDTPSPEEDDMQTLTYGVVGSAALAIVLGFISYYFNRIFGYSDNGETKNGYKLVAVDSMFM